MACPSVDSPTAQGWTNAEMKLAQMQARVFDDELSQLSTRIRRTSRRAVWAPTVTDAEAANEELERGSVAVHAPERRSDPAGARRARAGATRPRAP